jgi:hypothetical protein
MAAGRYLPMTARVMIFGMKSPVAGAAALLAACLIVGIVAIRHARDDTTRSASPARPPSGWTSYAPLEPLPVSLEALMSREQVIAAIGLPDEVFRKNARAECWAYTGPYTLRLCFGAKRRLAWWAGSTPADR